MHNSKRWLKKEKNIIQADVTEIRENINLYIEMFHHVPVNTTWKDQFSVT